jgi:hypothetical protein
MVINSHSDIFQSKKNYSDFIKQGFSTSSYLNFEQIEKLRKLYFEVEPEFYFDKGCSFSLLIKNIELRRSIHDEIVKICKPSLDNIFKDYKIFIAHFISKKSSSETLINLHQDPMFTDQAISPGLGVWTPLDDLTEDMGTFGIINHPPAAFPPFQAETITQVYKNVYPELFKSVTEFNPNAGESIFFDNRMIHYTKPNVSGKTRIGVTIKIAHKNAECITIHKPPQNASSRISVYKHKNDFYLDSKWIYDDTKDHGESEKIGVLNYTPYLEDINSVQLKLRHNFVNQYQKESIKSYL